MFVLEGVLFCLRLLFFFFIVFLVLSVIGLFSVCVCGARLGWWGVVSGTVRLDFVLFAVVVVVESVSVVVVVLRD